MTDINVGAISEALNNKADLDLHNLNNEGKKSVTLAGMVIAFAGKTAPDGWLPCNGAAVSRTTYGDLFAVIGTIYGAGDGSTTFNLPNLDWRVPEGRSINSQYIGEYDNGSLPKITGKFMISATNNTNDYTAGILGTEGAFTSDWPASNHSLGGGSGYSTNRRAVFDASRSSDRYRRTDNEVHTRNLGVLYIIKY